MRIFNSYIFRQSVTSLMIFYLLCLNGNADAKEYYQLIKKFSVQDGMVSIGILKMVRDVRGFYWMASPEGLCRFDGNRFMNFY